MLPHQIALVSKSRASSDHRNGFTAWYEAAGEVVGVLSLNADDDYRLADELVRSHTPITV